MTKQESLVLKGLAILFMLYYHLFSSESCVSNDCLNFITIDGVPFAYILSKATNPVGLYLIISGYGLFLSSNSSFRTRIARLLKILVYYWSVITVFNIIGHFTSPETYPGGWAKIIDNYSTLWASYNMSYWFLCPYLILMIVSPYLFRFFDKFRCRYVFIVTYIISLLTSYYVSRIGYGDWGRYRMLYNLFLSVHLISCFSIGYLLARTAVFSRYRIPSAFATMGVVLFFVLRCTFKIRILGGILLTFFVFCFLNMSRPRWMDIVLAALGKENLGMWLIHLWFSLILFHEWIYLPRHPFLIFLLLTTLSFCSAKLFSLALRPIINYIASLNK